LIRQMSMANPIWGAPRIHGELLMLGIEVSQATVGRYMPWRPKVPSPTWRSFLRNDMRNMAAVDMFVVATATFRLLYTLIVLGHDRRRIIHFEVTPNPTQVWLARQMTEAFPWDTAPRYLLRDRASYGQAFRDRVEAMAIKEVVTAAQSPWQNPYVERTSSSSTSATCAVCCHRIFIIITRPGRISRSTRIVRTPGQYTDLLRARSSRSPRSEDCIIATNAAPPKLPS
jgi:putative transposase